MREGRPKLRKRPAFPKLVFFQRNVCTLLVLFFLVGCGPDEPESILDQGARSPDAAGIVTDINFHEVQIDGSDKFAIDPEIESFTSREHAITALLRWKDRWYVHIGLEDNAAVWIAGIGIVVEGSNQVTYPGTFLRAEGDRAIFEDGTVFRMAEDINTEAFREGSLVAAVVDVERDLLVELRPQGAG